MLLSGADAPLDTDSHRTPATPTTTDRDYPMPTLNPAVLPAGLTALGGAPGQVPTDSLATAAASPGTTGGLVRLTAADRQIPTRVLAAYQQTATTLSTEQPGCHLRWQLLAGIGKVETNHATGRAISTDGTITPAILGPRLDGSGGFARIADTDYGRLDQDTTYDRAVGPMQFLPGTWTSAGRDGNHDNTKNPNNIDDATLATGTYLCAHGRDLANPGDLYAAIRAYNPSDTYVRAVLAWTTGYTNTTPSPGTQPTPAPTPAPTPTPPSTHPTAPATPFPIISLTPRNTTPTPTPDRPTTPASTCPPITLTTSTLAATTTSTTLDITGRYTTTGSGLTTVIHAEARDTAGHILTTTDTTIPTTPPAGPALLARVPLDHLAAPGQTTTITVTLTTTPTGCLTQTLITLTITGITRPNTPGTPTPTASNPAPPTSASQRSETPGSTPATP
ncbi:hypothetical protein BL253_37390 [Pseudofrankia asymbiotica]|uniref:Transglycosylase SLT domain-containing protein n=2 Tax=Pseudofrankia asymbiotica TaxID=1834516 RepID=A0A1V2HYX5_9ACTN|nr:hypothetical protein BL253_37390 [Pseudofrankia asymbiotica]